MITSLTNLNKKALENNVWKGEKAGNQLCLLSLYSYLPFKKQILTI